MYPHGYDLSQRMATAGNSVSESAGPGCCCGAQALALDVLRLHAEGEFNDFLLVSDSGETYSVRTYLIAENAAAFVSSKVEVGECAY